MFVSKKYFVNKIVIHTYIHTYIYDFITYVHWGSMTVQDSENKTGTAGEWSFQKKRLIFFNDGGNRKRTVFRESEHVMSVPIEIGRSSKAIVRITVKSRYLRPECARRDSGRRNRTKTRYAGIFRRTISRTYSTYGIFSDPRRCCPCSRPRCRTASGALCNARSCTGIRFRNTWRSPFLMGRKKTHGRQ